MERTNLCVGKHSCNSQTIRGKIYSKSTLVAELDLQSPLFAVDFSAKIVSLVINVKEMQPSFRSGPTPRINLITCIKKV